MKNVLILVISAVLLTACANRPSQSLFEQLGGHKGIAQMTDKFIGKIAKDTDVLPYFAKSNVTRFRLAFANHICEIADGPCRYEGDNMVDIHTGMNITEADFNRTVELLIEAMEETDIDYRTQNQLIARLAPMRSQIYKL